MDSLLMLLALPICLGTIIGMLSFVFQPVRAAERRYQRPTQFVMTDFVWLVVLVQVSIAPIVAYVPTDQPGMRGLGVVYMLLVVPVMWLGSIRTLSRAGVTSSLRRGTFLLLVVPVALLVTIALGIAVPAVVMTVFTVVAESLRGNSTLWAHQFGRWWPGFLSLGAAAAAAIIWTLRRLTFWVLDASTAQGDS